MVTKPEVAPVETPADKAETFARLVLAGHESGAVRRIVLYLIVAGTFALNTSIGTPFVAVYTGIGLIALIMLALTDQLT